MNDTCTMGKTWAHIFLGFFLALAVAAIVGGPLWMSFDMGYRQGRADAHAEYKAKLSPAGECKPKCPCRSCRAVGDRECKCSGYYDCLLGAGK